MEIKNAEFMTSSPSIKECPNFNLPEFALIGRSNVGKSSFINSLTGRNSLAKTSNKPGKTRLINLFKINDNFIIADLPGYGFANVSAKMQNQWQKNLEKYLLERKEIVSLIHFIDIRHDIQKNDLQMAEWIRFNKLPAFAIASKADEISKNQIFNKIKSFEKELQIEVFPFSKMTNRYNKPIEDKLSECIKSFF